MKSKCLKYSNYADPTDCFVRKIQYRRTVNLLDALICNKKLVYYQEVYGYETDRIHENSSVLGAVHCLIKRGFANIKLHRKMLGLYPPCYVYAGKRILCEIDLKSVIKRYDEYHIQQAVKNGLKWHHYYEKIGITKSFYRKFHADVFKVKTPLDMASLILNYKAKIKKIKQHGTIQTK